jgi:hypothetical protein
VNSLQSQRTSAEHWRVLTELLGSFERIVEQAARLDAYRPPLEVEDYEGAGGGRGAHGLALQDARRRAHVQFDKRLTCLRQRVGAEVTWVTAAFLVAELRDKQRRAGRQQPTAA